MNDQAPQPDAGLRSICQHFGVQRLSLFGSVLHGDARPGSDVDLLVEFPQDQTPGLFDLGELQQELSAHFGREVDLKTPRFLSPYFRNRVLAEARPLYAA